MVVKYEERFAAINLMRTRFAEATTALLDDDPRLALVLADISAERFQDAAARHPERVVNVGIREQLMIDVAGGMAMNGMRPIAHTFASFLVERPFEQIKIGLNHQDVGAVLVSAGASYDLAVDGRTHESPADVALLDTLEGWRIHVPGHAAEAERLLWDASRRDGLEYLRLSTDSNQEPYWQEGDQFKVLRRGSRGTVLAVGPMADPVLDAVATLDVTVLYAATIRPFDYSTLRRTLNAANVVLVEPYRTGTSANEAAIALGDIPHRLLALGVPREDHRQYGTPADHATAYGLDRAGLRAQIAPFLAN